MVRRLFLGVAACTAIMTAAGDFINAAGLAQQPPSGAITSRAASRRAIFDRYCVICHNERLKTAGVIFDALNVDDVGADAEIWEKVVRKLRAGSMPPAGRPRPDKAAYEDLASWLEGELDRAATVSPNPGRPTVHRLNRAEYTNAIRDLLAIDMDGRSILPSDNSGYGFDNIADVLSLSPGLLERYLSVARKVSRLAIGSRAIRPSVETYTISPALSQDARMSNDLPFGSRGGMVVHHRFPLDGEYVLKVRLQRDNNSAILGLNGREKLEVRLDGARVAVFALGGRFAREPGARTSKEEKDYRLTADAELETRFFAKAGTRLVGVAFLKSARAAPEHLGPVRLPVARFIFADEDVEPRVENVQIGGPYGATGSGDTLSRRRIFVCQPAGIGDEERCARRILSTLGRRAYRRPLTEADVQTLLSVYRAGRQGRDFDAGIEWALERILASPEFLFRIERDPENVRPGAPYQISDLELASRLSFFLWSSIPDDELLDLAVRGTLSEPSILEQQVRRMLNDDRATALVSNFAGQWLYLRNMRLVAPNATLFPEFDDNLRQALQRETELFVESQLREDRSALDLLRANYTFLNERLARHYDISNVYGSHFRRVTFDDDRRAGLLGHGSVLTVTSYPTRTSPVLRGKWLLENLLGAPPPSPPPNVPALRDPADGDRPTTVRERMEQHRKNPVCASCHARMDPLGFALENFDAIGRWRTIDPTTETPIDSSGTLPDGTTFEGPAELRTLLLSRREDFVMAVTEKLLTYALGRGLEYFDAPAVRRIVRGAALHDYRWSSIIVGLVKSMPFQMRMSQGFEDATSAPPRVEE